jgi:hypothetical protein
MKDRILSMKDAEDSLGGGPGSWAVEVAIATGKPYVPSNLNELEIEARIAKRQYLNQVYTLPAGYVRSSEVDEEIAKDR